MKLVIQRVKKAILYIEDKYEGEIEKGIVVFVGIGEIDTVEEVKYIGEKLLHLRIFEDEKNKMNYSISQIDGELMVVSQFTLYGETKKGNRPDFTKAAKPDKALFLYNELLNFLNGKVKKLVYGKFGSKMLVEIHNDGPVTIILETKNG